MCAYYCLMGRDAYKRGSTYNQEEITEGLEKWPHKSLHQELRTLIRVHRGCLLEVLGPSGRTFIKTLISVCQHANEWHGNWR